MIPDVIRPFIWKKMIGNKLKVNRMLYDSLLIQRENSQVTEKIKQIIGYFYYNYYGDNNNLNLIMIII